MGNNPKGLGSLDEVQPGDQVLVRIPCRAGDLSREVWGYVLEDRNPARGKVRIVIDEPVIIHHDPKYHQNSVIQVKRSDLIGLIRRPQEAPVLLVQFQEGALVDLRRIDGKTTAIKVEVDEAGSNRLIYRVDHKGMEAL